ncbi:MAG TPA: hypothetical protein VGP21_03120 [Opitutaceae bacterium]|nr:hypothetical protein [Opitutaceae bacterium]
MVNLFVRIPRLKLPRDKSSFFNISNLNIFVMEKARSYLADESMHGQHSVLFAPFATEFADDVG